MASRADGCALREGEGGGTDDAADLGEGCERDAPPDVDGDAAAPDRRGTMEGLNLAPPFSIRDDMMSMDGGVRRTRAFQQRNSNLKIWRDCVRSLCNTGGS